MTIFVPATIKVNRAPRIYCKGDSESVGHRPKGSLPSFRACYSLINRVHVSSSDSFHRTQLLPPQLLDEAETFSDAHTNRFGGRRSNVSDFIKGAVLEHPRRDNGSIKSSSSGTTLGPGSGGGNLELRGQR